MKVGGDGVDQGGDADGRKKEWRYWIKRAGKQNQGSISAFVGKRGQSRNLRFHLQINWYGPLFLSPSQHHNSEHAEQFTNEDWNLRGVEEHFKRGGQEDDDDESILQERRAPRNIIGGSTTEPKQRWEILPHDLGDARSDPSHAAHASHEAACDEHGHNFSTSSTGQMH